MKYLRYLYLPNLFATRRTKEILSVNPTIAPQREEARDVHVSIFDYSADFVEEKKLSSVTDCFHYKSSGHNTWINIDGLRKADVEAVCTHFNIHLLIIEDILSMGQRPKMDEVEGVLYCLLNMLYFNESKGTVETEQVSIVLGKDFVISFQEDANRDVFDPIRTKMDRKEPDPPTHFGLPTLRDARPDR